MVEQNVDAVGSTNKAPRTEFESRFNDSERTRVSFYTSNIPEQFINEIARNGLSSLANFRVLRDDKFSRIFSRVKLQAKGVLLVEEEYEDIGALTA